MEHGHRQVSACVCVQCSVLLSSTGRKCQNTAHDVHVQLTRPKMSVCERAHLS